MTQRAESGSGILVYDHPLSPYAQKVKIALLEKGVPFRTIRPEGIGSGTAAAAFGAASPRGEVPALVEEPEVRLFDSTIILEYIEDRWPDPPLLPREPLARARQRQIEEVMDTHFEAITWGLAEIRYFGRAKGELAKAMEGRAEEQLRGWAAWLTRALDGAAFFAGDAFGWGDLCVAPFLNGAVGLGLRCEGELTAWLSRVNERESVRQVREEAEANSFAKPEVDLDALKGAIEKGLFKREYRDHRLEWMIKSGGLPVVVEGLERENIRFIDVFRA